MKNKIVKFKTNICITKTIGRNQFGDKTKKKQTLREH